MKVQAVQLILALALAISTGARAQSLTPRAFWPAPRGTNVLALGYVYQEGDVLTDASLPIEDVALKMHALSAGYVYFFDLAGRTASLSVEQPLVNASVRGLVEGEEASRVLSGRADLNVRLAVNLLGAPSMAPEEFREFVKNPRPLLGASLRIVAPTGVYDPDRLVNLGSNRWAARPMLGYIRRVSRAWILEAALGSWIYRDNDELLGQTREQAWLYTTELHLVRPMRLPKPDFWVSLDATFYYGGRTRVGGAERDDLQRNSRVGLTVAIPFARRHAFKIAASKSMLTEARGDFWACLVAFQRAWR